MSEIRPEAFGVTSFQVMRQRITDVFENEIHNRLRTGLQRIVEHAAERAVHNAPLRDENLREHIQASPVTDTGDSLYAEVYVDGVPYALRQHEELIPAEGRDPPMLLGARSAVTDQDAPEGGPGGWYITRVVQFHANRYKEFLREIVANPSARLQ